MIALCLYVFTGSVPAATADPKEVAILRAKTPTLAEKTVKQPYFASKQATQMESLPEDAY